MDATIIRSAFGGVVPPEMAADMAAVLKSLGGQSATEDLKRKAERLGNAAMRQANTPEALAALHRAFNAGHTFAPGDLVHLKEGFRHVSRFPVAGSPAVVLEVLDRDKAPRKSDDGNLHQREAPLAMDLVIGLWSGSPLEDSPNEPLIFYAPSVIMEPWDAAKHALAVEADAPEEQ